MSNVWGSLGLAEVNTLRGGDGPAEFTAAAEADPLADRRLTDDRRGRRGARDRPGRRPSIGSTPRRSAGGRRGTASGWIVKILLLGARRRPRHRRADHRRSTRRRGATSPCSASTLVALNVVYLPRRFVPMKYLLPGLFFLAVFGIYPVLYTAYASTTNYGTGHVLSQVAGDRPDPEPVGAAGRGGDALRRHAAEGRRRSVRRLRPVRPGDRAAVPRHRHRADRARRSTTPSCTTLTTTGRTFVESRRRPHRRAPRRGAHAARLPATPTTYQMPGRDRGRGDHDLGRPGRREPRPRASTTPTTGTITDAADRPSSTTSDDGLLRRRRRHAR